MHILVTIKIKNNYKSTLLVIVHNFDFNTFHVIIMHL